MFFLLHVVSAALLILYSKIKRDYVPIEYALMISLCITVCFLSEASKFGYWRHKETVDLTIVNVTLTTGLIVLFGWAAGGKEKLKKEPLITATICAIILGTIAMPGVLLTIALMILGYARHEKWLLVIGTLFMIMVLWLYYYNLDVSLAHKSSILVASGAVMLLGRCYIRYKDWDKGGVLSVQS